MNPSKTQTEDTTMSSHSEFRALATVNIWLTALFALVCLLLLAWEQWGSVIYEAYTIEQPVTTPIDGCCYPNAFYDD